MWTGILYLIGAVFAEEIIDCQKRAGQLAAFVNMDSSQIEHGKTACGAACAVNVAQLLLAKMGRKLVSDPNELVNRLQKKPYITKEELTSTGFTTAHLRLAMEEMLTQEMRKFQKVTLQEFPSVRHIREKMLLAPGVHTILAVGADMRKKVTYQHYMVVTKAEPSEEGLSLTVSDPLYPEQEIQYLGVPYFFTYNSVPVASLQLIPKGHDSSQFSGVKTLFITAVLTAH